MKLSQKKVGVKMVQKKRTAVKKSVKQKDKAKVKPNSEKSPILYEISGLILIGFAIITFFELGIFGRIVRTISMFFFGNLHFFVPFIALSVAIVFMFRRKGAAFNKRSLIGIGLVLASFTIFSHSILFEQLHKSNLLLSNSVIKETWRILISSDGIINRSNALGGGMIGALSFSMLHLLFDSSGAKVVAWIMLVVGIILVTGKALIPFLFDQAPKMRGKINETRSRRANDKKRKANIGPKDEEASTVLETFNDEEPIISAFTEKTLHEKEGQLKGNVENDSKENDSVMLHAETTENEYYNLPPVQLLNEPYIHDQSGEFEIIQKNAKKLEQTLASFGVKVKVTQVHIGPAVTKYEVMPDVGVKVSRIVNLQDDLALALAAKEIRMEAPIPGKSAIGIEVPNSQVAIVTLREVLESTANNKPNSKLLVSFGRDVTGQAVLAELNKMPHLLVAGSTGSGKSVCINGIIVSLLMRAAPHEVKMMMIDPKMVELTVYNGIPHLLAPVVTDPRKAAQALQKVVAEMERRYDLFSHTGTRNIEGYNNHIEQLNEMNNEKHAKLPYIVVFVDELADLMMVAPGEVEDSIMRLAQMARAAGIHLIIATQRPSVDVITGIIKANIPSRIAFAVSSAVDSRTILDMGGAEKLLGRGDMLFLASGASKPTRVQGAFLSDEEVEKIVDYVIEQQKAEYEESMIPTDEPVREIDEEKDDLYDEAVQLVIEMQSASVSMLQRKFRIGYARAARIMDQMEMRGVVGPPDGSRPRQVLLNQINNS